MTANKSYFLFLWMRWKWATLAVVAANVATILCAVFDLWTDWLYILPAVALILWKGADAHRWQTAYEWSCRLGIHTTHYAPIYGKVTDGDMQAAQYFIRMYPWASRSVDYKLEPGSEHRALLFLKFHGNGLAWELPATQATHPLSKGELRNLMDMCRPVGLFTRFKQWVDERRKK